MTTTTKKVYRIVLLHCNIFDIVSGNVLEDYNIAVDHDGKIANISPNIDESLLVSRSNNALDCTGCFVLPGLIDCHVHVTAFTANFAELEQTSPSYVTSRSLQELRRMLQRGFTTVRDAGGADHGLARALEEGIFPGPRLLFCGKALSQTGGHGDMREPGYFAKSFGDCTCAGLGRVCDGDAEVRRAARDEIRKGATHIKVMAGGGVSSPTDRITSTQFSLMELKAIVEEATAANIHVMAHAYTPKAIMNCVNAGVRSIEHGNLLNQEAAKAMKEAGMYLVPTLATYAALAKEGKKEGLNDGMCKKIYDVLDAGKQSITIARKEKVTMCYGSDLLGNMRRYQLSGLMLMEEAGLSPLEVIRSATINAANLLGLEDEIGSIEVGKHADILVIRQDSFLGWNWTYKAILQMGELVPLYYEKIELDDQVSGKDKECQVQSTSKSVEADQETSEEVPQKNNDNQFEIDSDEDEGEDEEDNNMEENDDQFDEDMKKDDDDDDDANEDEEMDQTDEDKKKDQSEKAKKKDSLADEAMVPPI